MGAPLLTAAVGESLRAARGAGRGGAEVSLDLGRSRRRVDCGLDDWGDGAARYPYPGPLKERTVYHWSGAAFEPVARYGAALVKLVPTEWGTPTFEIDGVKMLVSAQVSPWEDARRKVALVEPRGKVVLDTCGGLGYFAAWCLALGAARIVSFEQSPDVAWLRGLNPWSPPAGGALELTVGDAVAGVAALADGSVDAVLHDPPRFALAGELYSQAFYDQLARVLRRRGRLFHYVGKPNALTSGRDVPREVARRLARAGFDARLELDGVLAVRRQAAGRISRRVGK